MKIKNVLILVVIVLIVVVGFVVFLPGKTNTIIERTVGSASGPDMPWPYTNVNGVVTYASKVDMRTATTSLCAFVSPSATSTIEYVSWKIIKGTTTAATIDIGTSTTGYATTTNLVSGTSVVSGAQGGYYWTPAGAGTDDAKMSPNTYVNVMTAGAGLGGYTFTGSCQAVFRVY